VQGEAIQNSPINDEILFSLDYLLGLTSYTSASLRWSLKGKKAVVTGGSKGIGKACVEDLCGLACNCSHVRSQCH
jgi:hypothetical protein